MEDADRWISLRRFSREREVSLAAVQKAIASGRVTAVKRDEVTGRLTGIDRILGIEQWNANTDLDQAARAGAPLLVPANTTPVKAAPLTGGGDNPAGAAGPLPIEGATTPPSSSDDFGYLKARAEKEISLAERAKLDNLERIGLLVSADAVREEQFAIFRKLRDNIIAIGSRLGPRLAAETDPVRVQTLIDEEHRKALHELSRALGVDAAGGAGERSITLQ